jgi:hypothetical protein
MDSDDDEPLVKPTPKLEPKQETKVVEETR